MLASFVSISALLTASASVSASLLVSAETKVRTLVEKRRPGVYYSSFVDFPPDSTGLSGQESKNLTYYGGPVIPNVEVTMLLWGINITSADRLPDFYAAVTNSEYYDMLSEYSTENQTIGRGSFKETIHLTGYSPSNVLDDAYDIQPYLRSLVAAGTLAPTENSYYAIHFAPFYHITLGEDESCRVFCAYHGTIDISDIPNTKTRYLYYGIMPDQGGACRWGCGSNRDAFNNLCSVSSHELVEATTDPAVGLAGGYSFPLAWYNEQQGEIGDICNGYQGKAANYTVQKQWSNKANACVDH